MAQSVPERMAIISAGVVMNVIFAFVMATVAYMLGVKELPCRLSQVFAGALHGRLACRPATRSSR